MRQENNTIFKAVSDACDIDGSDVHKSVEREKLVVQRSGIRKQIAETTAAQKAECALRDKMRGRIEDFMCNMKRFSFDSRWYVMTAGYPFVTNEEKVKLLSVLEEVKSDANVEYYAQKKELDKMRERLNLHIENIKVLGENLGLLKKYFANINNKIKELEE
jgi:hypothetical protein